MRTFIYKRTHKGDPDKAGCFGIYDCMGRFRHCDFDAVIGVGGIGRQAKAAGIDGRLNWIGIGPRKEPHHGISGPVVTFDHFVLFEEKGKKLFAMAPILARRMYSRHGPRFLFNDKFNEAEQTEIARILRMAKTEPRSAGMAHKQSHVGRRGCPPGGC
jgi:hypothetical protein